MLGLTGDPVLQVSINRAPLLMVDGRSAATIVPAATKGRCR
jgi:hypothetical protein